MISLTAIIRAKPGAEEHIRQALLEVGRFATASEPGTQAYFVTASNEQGVFVTHERYRDQASLDAHNNGEGAKTFFAAAEGHLLAVDVHVGTEVFPQG